ncbi:penicillin binding protein PBP4B [Tissierellaceae bacterium HCP3S3_D8]
MMKNKRIRFSSILLVLIIFLTSFTSYAAEIEIGGKTGEIWTISSQIEPKFPDENPTDRIFAQNRRTFKGYEGRGQIIVENHGAKSAEIYINGKLIDIKKALEDETEVMTIDIGKYTVNGENLIKVLNVKPEESYIKVHIPYPSLAVGKAHEVGFSDKKLAKVDELINSEVEEGFPGAVLLIIKDGKIVKNTAYGYKLKYDGEDLLDEFVPMEVGTIFDLASNTKMFSTNIAIQKLISEGKIKIEDKVIKYIPNFKGDGRENIRIKDLLTHSAGFSSSIRFYMPDNPYGEEFYSDNRERTLKLLEKAPLEYETGTKTIYSDTDYMLLGYIIENVTGKRLDEYVEKEIYEPLGLKHTMYVPLEKGLLKEQFAATETMGNTRGGSRDYPNIRKHTLQGEVHDEKAYYSMDGVSGHAGLFSTAGDMAVLCQSLLNGGGYGNNEIFNNGVLDQFTKPSDSDITFGLGWNRAGNMDKIWQFGPYASNLAIGHTGWTGSLTVIDPKYDMAIVLLTNKKHSNCVEDKFEGDKFETGKYGSVVSLIYEALLENN